MRLGFWNDCCVLQRRITIEANKRLAAKGKNERKEHANVPLLLEAPKVR